MRKKLPTIGDKRKIIRFAYFPIITEDRYKVWWEKYVSVEEFKQCQSNGRWVRTSAEILPNSVDFIVTD